jgi:hypothetical protein
VPSFLSEPGPLIRTGPARARIELGRAGLGPGPNNGLRAYWTSIAETHTIANQVFGDSMADVGNNYSLRFFLFVAG